MFYLVFSLFVIAVYVGAALVVCLAVTYGVSLSSGLSTERPSTGESASTGPSTGELAGTGPSTGESAGTHFAVFTRVSKHVRPDLLCAKCCKH